jgi:exosortase
MHIADIRLVSPRFRCLAPWENFVPLGCRVSCNPYGEFGNQSRRSLLLVRGAIAPEIEFAYAQGIQQILRVSQIAQVAPLSEHPEGIANGSWWRTAVLVLLLGWLYFPVLTRLAAQWWQDPNFSHGFFVPAFSLFVLWQDRSRLLTLPHRPSSWGLVITVLGLTVLIVGSLGAELFLSRVSFVVVIAGLVIFFLGWNYFRAVLFPWAFLLLMIPIPAILFNQITFPLQILASKVAAAVLPLAGVPVLREGNIINLPAMPLEVAQACSGIRSLLSLGTLAVIYGYLMETRNSLRTVLALASIPIAVIANSLRIVGTGLLVQYWDPDKAEGFFHAFSGWLIFVVSLGMLFLFHHLLLLLWPAREKTA